MRQAANHLPRPRIMTERVSFQKEFAPVERPSSPVVSDAADGMRGFWTAASGGCQLELARSRQRCEPQQATTKSPSHSHGGARVSHFLSGLPLWALIALIVVLPTALAMTAQVQIRRWVGIETWSKTTRSPVSNSRLWRHLCRASGLFRHRRVGKIQRRADFRRRGGRRDSGALSLCRGQGTRGGRPASGARQLPQDDNRRGMARDGPRIRGPRGHERAQHALLDGAGAQSVRDERHGGHVGGLPADRQCHGGAADQAASRNRACARRHLDRAFRRRAAHRSVSRSSSEAKTWLRRFQ